MRILIAPDKFKGSLAARQAAEAMAAGVRDALPIAKLDLCPLADGGEGTLDTIVTAANGHTDFHDVCGPLPGMRVNAPLGWIDNGKTAVVELAAASGLQLVPFERRDPTRTTTFGTGELISIAVRQGAKRVIVGIGGSATCDGGLGIAQACGAAIRLRSGKTYSSADRKITGADLGKVVSIARRDGTPTESPRGILRFAGVDIVVAADVGNPLFGPDGAAHIFAPQKGASAAQVKQLDDDLRQFAERMSVNDIAESPAAGAGGGAAFGLMAFFGASAVSGASVIFDELNLTKRLANIDLCLTGEGRFDLQSLGGKAPIAVAQACRDAGVPCVVLAGSLGDGYERAYPEGVTAAFSILNRPMAMVDAQEHAAALLRGAARDVVRLRFAAGNPRRKRSS